jgi:enediyne biosynthesis protein E4
MTRSALARGPSGARCAARPASRGRGRAPGRTLAVALMLAGASCGESAHDADGTLGAHGGTPEQRAPVTAPSTAPGDAPASTPEDSDWFTDVAAEAGIDFVHDAGMTQQKQLQETMGAGGLLADLDGDDDLDIYLVQGGPVDALADSPPHNRLFLNDGAGHFTDATAASGHARGLGYGMGAVAGDVEGDGDLDLFLTNGVGPARLLLNDGRARFTDATEASGIDQTRWTTAATFFDGDGDGDLDLYVTGYLLIDFHHGGPWCGERKPGYRSYCHPDVYEGLPALYWRNVGGGRFEDATKAAGLRAKASEPEGKGLGVLALDVEPDGDLDLYVANDSLENRLWINDGAGHFHDGTLLSGTGVDAEGRTEASMGLASGDVNGDGRIDLYSTGLDDESDTLYRNEGGALFTDVTVRAGLEAPTRKPVSFGAVLADLDNDGDLDAAVANGHIIDNIALYDDGQSWAQRARLFVNDGRGGFRDATDDSGDFGREPRVGRGLYTGDIDRDGDLDLLATQCNGRAVLLRNNGGPGAGAEGRARDGAGGGAVVLAGLPPGTLVRATLASGTVLVREAGTQTSYLGQCSPELHLGLGADAVVALTLEPPGGPRTELALPAPRAAGRLHFLKHADGLRLAEPRAPDSTLTGPDKP